MLIYSYSKFIGERNASQNGESESKHELIFNYRSYIYEAK